MSETRDGGDHREDFGKEPAEDPKEDHPSLGPEFTGEVLFAWLSFGLYQLFHDAFMVLGFLRKRWLYVEVDSAVTG